MNLQVPTLSTLKKQVGNVAVEAYIKLWLLDLNVVLDLKHPMKPRQIDTAAVGILQKYPSLNIAEINLIFTRVKFGEYTGTYDRVSVPTVMKWFSNYFDERSNAAAQASQQKHLQSKSNFGSERSSLVNTKQYMKNLKEAHSLDQTKQKIETIKKSMK